MKQLSPSTARRRKTLAFLGGIVVAALLVELGLRAALFGGFDIGWSLRRPSRFADYQSEEDHFKLAALWRSHGQGERPSHFQPALGWVSAAIDPETLTHTGLNATGDRQRIVLYGDSYSHCVTPPGTRYQDHVERSFRGETHQLLNYGVSGFGLDQVTLLLEATIDDVTESNPVVLIGVFVDDDLDRCGLGLRGYPKPRFELRGAKLHLTGTPIPTRPSYIEEHPLSIPSYLWRLLARGPLSGPLRETPFAPPDRSIECAELATALTHRIISVLQSRSIRVGFVLFEGEERTASSAPVSDWRMNTMLAVLEARGVPWLRTRDNLRSNAASTGRNVRSFFGQEGELANHFTAQGNELITDVLMDFASDCLAGAPPSSDGHGAIGKQDH